MRKAISVAIHLLLFVVATHMGLADSTWEFSVQVSARVQASPAQITLTWPQDTYTTPNSYTIYRKTPAGTSWGQGTVLPGTATSYTDASISPGIGYEYQVVKKTSQYVGYGYVYSGVNLPLVDSRGKLLLVVDNTYASQLAPELTRLQQDLVGDGWTVTRTDVSRNASVNSVKDQIRANYAADPGNVKAVFLFGHVPVPYSGDLVPDGHIPDHQGAWPCDGFYGDMDGTWTDISVNDSGATEARNRNVPGDGKFDQSTFPAPLKLMVGRVDLANMPGRQSYGGPATFPSELELLRNYLNKDHKFRHKGINVERRAYVADFFGYRDGEAFAASGYRNFASWFGADQVTRIDQKGVWVPTLSRTPVLAAYGCGAGTYTSAAGLGNTGIYNDAVTTEIVGGDIKTVFALLFGSWLGDWDNEDNFLRAVLALPTFGLASVWSGRPHWYLHHMAMGETIGYGTRLTQNNGQDGIYKNQINSAAGQTHIALMGDPSLRLHPVAPPTDLVAQPSASVTELTWNPSADEVAGYHIYTAPSAAGPFTRVTTTPVTDTYYAHASAAASQVYMVRAVKLESSASGTYWNASQGAFSTGDIVVPNTANTTPATPAATNPNTNTTTTPTPTVVGATTTWIDDALPSGATGLTDGGDYWNWIRDNPAPVSGTFSHQSSAASGLHQHFFVNAQSTLSVDAGDTLFAYVQIDPANPPLEIMLQWFDGSWDHRAYWGANLIPFGNDATTQRRYMGALPAPGQWVKLEIPARLVNLEGRKISGMAFSQFNGRAAWDAAGKISAGDDTTTTPPVTPGTNTNSSSFTNAVLWMDDSVPTGAQPGSDGGDVWNWVTENPSPSTGARAVQSSANPGLHQVLFTSASRTLSVGAGDTLITSVYLDPANPPSEIMLQWHNGSWEHRAFWGANVIGYGIDGTTGRHYMGPLPATGTWVQLRVPASAVALEGQTVTGMAFTLYDGRATWDSVGKIPAATTTDPNSNPGSTNTAANMVAWFDDATPSGAITGSDGGDSWNWASSNPAPFSGTKCMQSISSPGMHQVFFHSANQKLSVATGEKLFAYVFLDPASPPSQIMLQWNDGTWDHRAYWGANYLQYGTFGTPGRRAMGALPTPGQWVRLQVPASQVALEGSTLQGMALTAYDGRVSWDLVGKLTTVAPPPDTTAVTNTPPPVVVTPPPVVITTNTPPPGGTGGPSNLFPGVSVADYVSLEVPKVGECTLHILTPTTLELKLINTKQPDPAPVSEWDWVDANGNFQPPAPGSLTVLVNGSPIDITSVGFKRRPLYAPFEEYDLRIENSLYLQLASPVSEDQVVEVKNNDGSLWSAARQFSSKMEPLRFSPAIHVNQEGYLPGYTKKAMVGYYLGNLGELNVSAGAGFKVVDALTGATVFQGSLTRRVDTGYSYTPTPYQKVYEADFTAFNTPGQYRLVVPGMGGSLPFLINSGVAMSFARAYALGLYHQRCGTATSMPYTRHTHDVCHAAPAKIPMPESDFAFTWTTIADYARRPTADNPLQTAPTLSGAADQLFPFQQTGTLDVSGGHHDAGDYSKYTANSANLIHYLMFAVDSLPGVSALDNLGIPESGDGISDVLQEAKWEADYVSKLQDSDGGFYFLVYPEKREYEAGVTPDKGDPQVVWPKTTSVTAAAVAALAQCASSPAFKRAYPEAAARFLQQAKLGWAFIQNALAKYGRNGAYQKITHYADTFTDQDEIAWAACEMFLATGDQAIHSFLRTWFDPSDPGTWRWGWWHMAENFGHAIRSYAFGARSGRLPASAFDTDFAAKCRAEIMAAADSVVNWSRMNAYGTSFPDATKRVKAAGWYFSTDQAFDVAVGYQIQAKADYITALLANMNYEGGCNPVNVTYVTGLGWKRQRDIVSQWAATDRRVLPPSGIPVGNIQANFGWLWNYGGMLQALCFPSDNAPVAPYPFYDRWGDSWNVSAEFVVLNSARSLGCLAFLAAQTLENKAPWKAVAGAIHGPTSTVEVGEAVTLSLSAPGVDLTGARVVWESRGQEPQVGPTAVFVPRNNGTQWVEAEAQLPDGRRVFAVSSYSANAADIAWCDDALPAGATTGSDGGDSWAWSALSPTPAKGVLAHASALASGGHQHFFQGATATLDVGVGDTLYAWVYLDPINPPSEVMLQWNDGNGWNHRAYWGANQLNYGLEGTSGRFYAGALPGAGQWVQLKVPAADVALEGATLNGMAFSLYGGRATWDAAGRLSQAGQPSKSYTSSVSVSTSASASRAGSLPGLFTFTRTGSLEQALTLEYSLSGTARDGLDFESPGTIVIPAGSASAGLTITPVASPEIVGSETLMLSLLPKGYNLGNTPAAEMVVFGNTIQVSLTLEGTKPRLAWNSLSNHRYRVAYKNSLSESVWQVATEITAGSAPSTWVDTQSTGSQRFYLVAQID